MASKPAQDEVGSKICKSERFPGETGPELLGSFAYRCGLLSPRAARVSKIKRMKHAQKQYVSIGRFFRVAKPLFMLALLVSLSAALFCKPLHGQEPKKELTLDDIPFNGTRAYEYLKQLCDLGPRWTGSDAMVKQQELLIKHFKEAGGVVYRHEFKTKHPLTKKFVPVVNIIVEWNPEAKDRILLCAHYDTRPVPDNDPNPRIRRTGKFIGANDGASGTALLMELAHMMPKLKSNYGVDFVLFDAEELVFGDGVRERQMGRYFVGSEEFARKYKRKPPKHKYKMGVLLDMVGDKDLQLFPDRFSFRNPKSRVIVRSIWGTAEKLGVKEFIPFPKYNISDDHLALNKIARIPTCDIIDFNYPKNPKNIYWHTEQDTPDKCSALSLAKVGWVIHEWLSHVK